MNLDWSLDGMTPADWMSAGAANGANGVPPELARFVAPAAAASDGQSPGRAGLTALANVLRERSDHAGGQAVRAARERRRDDALKAEGKSAGLLEAARLLAELAGEL